MTHSLLCTSCHTKYQPCLSSAQSSSRCWSSLTEKSTPRKKYFDHEALLASLHIETSLTLRLSNSLFFHYLIIKKKSLLSLSLCARPEAWAVNKTRIVLLLKSLRSGYLSVVPWIWPIYRNLSVCTEYAHTCHPSGPVWILIIHQSSSQVFPPMSGVVSLL